MIHVVRIYQSAASRKNKAAQKIYNSQTIQDLETSGRTGLTLASRSCSLLKVDPQVLHRHPVMGVRTAFASFIRDGLNDNPSSPPHCKHKRLVKNPSSPVQILQLRFSSSKMTEPQTSPPSARCPGWGAKFSLQELNVVCLQTFRAFDDLELHGLAFLKALEAG